MWILNKIKNMKAIKYITGLMILFSVAIWSCSDNWLELHPISSMNEGDFYKTEQDFQTAIVAAYQTLTTEFGAYSGPSYCEQLSDEAWWENATNPIADKLAWQNFNLNPTNTTVQSIYRDTYVSLYTINTLLAKLSGASIDAGRKAVFEGEARLLRGMYYFNLVREFGDVPLVKKPLTVSESYELLRSPATDVYKTIISDMRFAAGNLPLHSQRARTGQLTKGAAQGMLGKVYLTLNNKDSAAYFLNEVIQSGEYNLVTDYANLWGLNGLANKNTKEALIEIQFVGAANSPNSGYQEAFSPYQNFAISGQGQGMNQATDYLWDEYEVDDPRRNASISEGYTNSSGVYITSPTKFQAKWFDDVYVRTGQNQMGSNFIILRYSDILLMYAEATDDVESLNKVRRRVGLPEWGDATYPIALYPTLKLAIEHERFVELALEFHRFFDLKRAGRATTVLTDRKGKTITEDMLVLPIPLAEIDINPQLTQNSYYIN